jgi:hypothetical protein
MGRIVIVISILLLFICSVAQADCFRCGSSIVCTGETTGDVALKCGQPSFTETVRVDTSGAVVTGNVNLATESVESWYYNCGEGRLNRTLYFKAGVLANIKSSDNYGTGPAKCE